MSRRVSSEEVAAGRESRRTGKSRRKSCEGSCEAFAIEVRFELSRLYEVVVQVVVGGVA